MNNLSQLKKRAKDYTWEQYHNDWFGGPLPEGHKLKGLKRKVEKEQTNAIRFEGGSWLNWDKASAIASKKILLGL
jgi:hypothetical protein